MTIETTLSKLIGGGVGVLHASGRQAEEEM